MKQIIDKMGIISHVYVYFICENIVIYNGIKL